jgi:hypothetical protein
MEVWAPVVGTLLGVAVGWGLDRRTRKDERAAADARELRSVASEVLGRAKMVLDASNPVEYAAFASESIRTEIGKRRDEAERVRPELTSLAIRWPAARAEITAVARYLAFVPNTLELVVRQVLENRALSPLVDDMRRDYQGAEDALDRVIGLLDSTVSEGSPVGG